MEAINAPLAGKTDALVVWCDIHRVSHKLQTEKMCLKKSFD